MMNPADDRNHAYLIVNADDFGYFRCVSRGIADAYTQGSLTATAVLSNFARFEDDLDLLRESPGLDLGVHLNLTAGEPLSASLREKLSSAKGHFPTKLGLVRAIVTGSITPVEVEDEWKMQIERCLDVGLKLRFLNSHEHMHMLPTLIPVVQRLAQQFDINHIRVSTPDPIQLNRPVTLIRDLPLLYLSRRVAREQRGPAIGFLGMGVSGRLTFSYLQRWIPQLQKGNIYELMCHPGFFDAAEINDPDLVAYHDWQSELRVLTDPSFKALLETHGVKLIRYRDIGNVT
jgi:predicted glycoside hydrolase/deacetylase ChbG (UPF0249 family)